MQSLRTTRGLWRDGIGKWGGGTTFHAAKHSRTAISSLTMKRSHRSVSRRAHTLFTARPSRRRTCRRREASDADFGSPRASATRQVYQARDFVEAPKRNAVHVKGFLQGEHVPILHPPTSSLLLSSVFLPSFLLHPSSSSSSFSFTSLSCSYCFSFISFRLSLLLSS